VQNVHQALHIISPFLLPLEQHSPTLQLLLKVVRSSLLHVETVSVLLLTIVLEHFTNGFHVWMHSECPIFKLLVDLRWPLPVACAAVETQICDDDGWPASDRRIAMHKDSLVVIQQLIEPSADVD